MQVLLYTIKDFSIGGGGNNLIESRVKYQGEGGSNVSYLLKRHYFAQMAYSIPLADQNVVYCAAGFCSHCTRCPDTL